jgi:hypothetical protein
MSDRFGNQCQSQRLRSRLKDVGLDPSARREVFPALMYLDRSVAFIPVDGIGGYPLFRQGGHFRNRCDLHGIDQDIALSRRFHGIATEHAELEAFTQSLSITTYRFVPADLADRTEDEDVSAYLNELNEALLDRMEGSGRAFVSNAVLDGIFALRMCVVNFRTALEDVTALAEITAEIGRTVDGELRPDALR